MVEEPAKSINQTAVNVLLVDDRPDNLLVMETILADLNQNLVCATSAREALRFLLVEDVALILLDVQMPGLNGFELAEIIRERERTQDTPIIFVSATSVDEAYVFKGYSLGAVDYLTKPFTPEILRSKVSFFTKLFRQNQEIKRQAKLLERANAELDAINTDLEARVAERTLEIEQANVQLAAELAVRMESEARLALEHSITRTVAYAESLEAAAPEILRSFCEEMNAGASALWLFDSTGSRLVCTAMEICKDTAALKKFKSESMASEFELGVGLPGHVWEQNKPVALSDSYRGGKFPREKYARNAGLHHAFGFPIKIADRPYGVIEFFTSLPITPDTRSEEHTSELQS